MTKDIINILLTRLLTIDKLIQAHKQLCALRVLVLNEKSKEEFGVLRGMKEAGLILKIHKLKAEIDKLKGQLGRSGEWNTSPKTPDRQK